MKKILKMFSLVLVIIAACILPMACSSNGNSIQKVTITFDSCGGGEISPMENVKGEKLWYLPTASRDGYMFLGWYTDLNSVKTFKAETVINSDITLYAKWAKYLDDDCDYELNEDDTYTITNYSGNYEAIVLPEEYNGKSITVIGDNAFKQCSAALIFLPKETKKIGTSAFYGCNKLKSIELPWCTKEIGANAFNGCKTLSYVDLCSANSIGYQAFANCTNLKRVFIGYVETIGVGVFDGCKSLTKIYCYPESKPSGWENGWKGSARGTPMWSCSTIGSLVFQNDDRTNVVGYMEYKGWYSYGEIVNDIVIDEVQRQGEDGFYSVPITTVADYAFSNCSHLNTIVIGENVEHIGKYAFYECTNLTSIIIPRSVTRIDDYAFSGCSGLTTIYCEAQYKPDNWSSNWNFDCKAKIVWGYSGNN